MTISPWQDIGYWLVVIGAVLMAADIMGPLLAKCEGVIERILSFRFLQKMEKSHFLKQWLRPDRKAGIRGDLLLLFGIGALLTLIKALGDRKEKIISLREELSSYIFLFTVAFFAFVLAGIFSLLLACLYIISLMLDILFRVLTSPYRLSLWLRDRYAWPSPVKTIGLILFLLGSAMYYFAS